MTTQPTFSTHSGEPDDKLVMVGRFLDPAEAQMAKGMLESQGIECFLAGANSNAMLPLAFRVRLQVFAADEEEARMLLGEAAAGVHDGD